MLSVAGFGGRETPLNPDVPPVKSLRDIPACAAFVRSLGFRDVKVNYPLTETDLLDVTDQFEMRVIKTDDGRTGFMLVKLEPEPETLGCLDGPSDL